jgi:NADH-quinone oxidoreductase subunit L
VTVAVLVPLFPLAGWIVNGLAGGRLGRRAVAWVACGVVVAAFAAALTVFVRMHSLPPGARSTTVDLYSWIAAGSVSIPLRLLVDPLSTAMALVVSGVGALIHIYSVGYMAEDEGFARYFAYLNLFTAAMLWLVLAGNLVVMFIGWEGVGLCSYLLVAFWFTRSQAAAAGVKAFLVTRLGDIGFLLGIFLAFVLFGTSDFTTMTRNAASVLPMGGAAATALTLLLFLGATGKSAQLPLYIWLPDAMEGPTPVSALIHAATMVTAGVYMIVRLHAVYLRAPVSMDAVAIVGAATAVFASASALVEPDLKRVLAYSTISQLGYMFLAVGVGAWSAGIFHLTSHAFFKALLFLAAGAVMHALGGTTDMRRMGGLARYLPGTAAAFAVGSLALAGIPPFTGFFSKDTILSQAFRAGQIALWAVGIAAAGLTAIYIVRAFALTFVVPPAEGAIGPGGGPQEAAPTGGTRVTATRLTGPEGGSGHVAPPRGRNRAEEPASPDRRAFRHEEELRDPPPVMAWPTWALAVLSLLGGVLGWSFTGTGFLAGWLRPVVQAGGAPPAPHVVRASEGMLVGISVAVAVVGIVFAWAIYARRSVRGRSEIARTVLAHQFYVEDLYNIALLGPTRAAAVWASWFDRAVIDGGVMGLARAVGGGGGVLRRLQSGYLRYYATFVLIGVLVLLGYWIWR